MANQSLSAVMACQEQIIFKGDVMKKLFCRNENEREKFEDVIHLINSLYEKLDFYQKENLRLRVDMQINSDPGSSIDKKILLLQEELQDSALKNADYVLRIRNLQKELDKKEEEIETKNDQIEQLEASLENSKLVYEHLLRKLSETEHNLQFIKDEHDALRITYASIEEKRLKLEKENRELISRLIEMKSEDADRLNTETEMFMRKKQEKLQKDLEEAAREPDTVDTNRPKRVCLDAILPRKAQFKFDAHDGEVNAVAWTHNADRFATAGGDRRVKIWDLNLGIPCLKGIAEESNSSVYSVDFDTEETLILAASCDFACRVWSLCDMKIKHTLTGHSGKVMSAKFLVETGQVVSGSHDRTLKLWDLRRRACMRTILAGSSVNDVVTTGNSIVSGHYDRKIRFWDVRSESSTNEILLQGRITSLDLSVDGNSLLSCGRDDTLKLIEFRMNKVVRTFSADGFLIGCDWTRAKFSPDGQFCVCGSQDGAIYIWKILQGNVEKVLRKHYSTVIACAWSWCGNYLLSCDKNKKAILWTEF